MSVQNYVVFDRNDESLCGVLLQCFSLKSLSQHSVKFDSLYKKICDGGVVLCVHLSNDGKVGGFAFLHEIVTVNRIIMEVHDVFVPVELQGQGIGRKLVESLISFAQSISNRHGEEVRLSLTCNPLRIPANALYRKLGFVLIAPAMEHVPVTTNLYSLVLYPQKTAS